MTHVTCRVTKDDIAPIFELTAKNRDQLRNPTLGNRVWAGYLYLFLRKYGQARARCLIGSSVERDVAAQHAAVDPM